jgi:DNA repair exonuclease SbcCD nuclease subunit
MKLLHTADWQIGKLFGQFESDEAALLADARFTTVERLARCASAEGVALIVVAGDVFDAQGVADKTIHRLMHALSGFSGQWVMIPGNHDAALAESVWTRARRLAAIPPNLALCLHPEPLILAELGVALLPAPLTQRITYADLTEWFADAATPPGLLRIGVAHGSVQGILADGIDSSNPIAAGRAEQARLDYLALGDWHGMRRIDAHCWYSGTPETDRFRANDSGHVLIVDLDETRPGSAPTVTPLAVGQYRWRAETHAVNVPSDLDGLIEHLAAGAPNDVMQLEVAGRTDLAGHARLLEAIARACGRLRSLVVDMSALRLEPTDEDIVALHADGYLGDVIDELRAAQDGADGRVAREALTLLAGFLDKGAS